MLSSPPPNSEMNANIYESMHMSEHEARTQVYIFFIIFKLPATTEQIHTLV
jgi:hypothetical protein